MSHNVGNLYQIVYLVFCTAGHARGQVTHTFATKRAARKTLRILRADFPEYEWRIRRFVEQKIGRRRKRRKKKQ